MGKIVEQNVPKCATCQFYDKENDKCTSSGKEKYSSNIDFSKCKDYLVADKLIHY